MDLVWRSIQTVSSVKAQSDTLKDYRYLENQLMEMLAGWTLLTPETNIKVLFGEHLYEDAQHVDSLRSRILELLAPPDPDLPPSDEIARLCEKVWNAPDTITRLVGVYAFLKPRLAESYYAYARIAEPLVDAPTHSLLLELWRQESRQVQEGMRCLDRLSATNAAREAANLWMKNLEERLSSSPGIHSVGARGHYTFRKQFPKGIVGVRERPFWYANDPSELPVPLPFTTQEGKILAMHTLLNGEIGTVERMAKILAEFPDLPWPMRLALARQAWDEARHIEIVASTVRDLGGGWGQYPFNCTFWKVHVDRADPLERLALGNAKFEGQLCSQLREWIDTCRADGSQKLADILDYLLADELPHVRNGKKWIPVVAKNDPSRQASVLAWAEEQARQLMGTFDASSARRI